MKSKTAATILFLVAEIIREAKDCGFADASYDSIWLRDKENDLEASARKLIDIIKGEIDAEE